MRTGAVRRYAAPQYPTRQYLAEHPELLRWIPERWRQHRLVLGVLSMVIPLVVSRPAAAGDAKGKDVGVSRVAPLFIHGEGRGSFGCVAVNPPVFLSEDEARQVVQDEARKEGVVFAPDDLTIKCVKVPVTDEYEFLLDLMETERAKEAGRGKEKALRTPRTQRIDLVMDGYDKKHDVAYEVVTQKDFADWEAKDRSVACSVSSYDFKTAAQRLTNGLAQAGATTRIAVFYEPGASAPEMKRPARDATENDWKAYLDASRKAARDLGEKQLREQVRDFLEWLKAQGVI